MARRPLIPRKDEERDAALETSFCPLPRSHSQCCPISHLDGRPIPSMFRGTSQKSKTLRHEDSPCFGQRHNRPSLLRRLANMVRFLIRQSTYRSLPKKCKCNLQDALVILVNIWKVIQ